jgi:hypothetical protein
MDQRLKTITVEPGSDLTIQRGNVNYTYTTPSTSVLTGSITTNGGIGINNTSDSTSSTAGGALSVGGGLAVFKKTYLGNNLIMDSSSSTLSVNGSSTERFFIDSVSNKTIRAAPNGVDTCFTLTDTGLTLTHTANATSSTNAALKLAGGIGISNASATTALGQGGSITADGGASFRKQLFVGGDSFINGPSTGTNDVAQLVIGPAVSTSNFNSASQIRSTSSSGTDSSSTLEFFTHQAATASVGTLRLSIDNVGDVRIMSQTNATNVSTGSLILAGGIATNRKSFMGDQMTIETGYIGNTAAHLIMTNSGSDTAGVDRDTRLLLHSKSNGESTILFRNTLDTTIGNMELSYTHTGNQVGTIGFKLDETTSLVDVNSDKTLVVHGTQISTSSTTGSIQTKGGIGVQSRSFFNDLVHFESTLQLKGSSQVYQVVGGGDAATGIAFTGKSAATASSYNFFTSDGDGTDNNAIKLFAVGTPNAITNSELLKLEWDQSTSKFRISANNTGTGVMRPINIESGSTNQLVIGTGGNIGINSGETQYKLNVSGTVNTTGITTISNTSDTTGLTSGALQVEGGLSVDKKAFVGKGITIGNGLSNSFSSGDALLTFDIENPWVFQTTGTGASNNLVLKATVDDSDFIIRDSNNIDRFTFQVTTTGTSVLTIDGTLLVDYTNAEAVLVRKNGDGGDVLAVDTTNTSLKLGPGAGIQNSLLSLYGTVSNPTLGPHIMATTTQDTYPVSQLLNYAHDNVSLNFDSYYTGSVWASSHFGSNFQMYKTSNTLQFNYASSVSQGSTVTWATAMSIANTGTITLDNSTIIDVTSTQALLVRRNGNSGTVFTIDTTNNTVNVNSTVTSTSTSTGALQVGGGIGIAKEVVIGSTIDATNATTGALIIEGGITIKTTANASSVTNGGSLLTRGGIAVGKDIFIGGNIDTLGPILHRGTTSEVVQFYDNTNVKRWGMGKNGSETFIVNRYNASGVLQEQSIGINNTTGKTTLANTSASVSTSDSALIVNGGISVGTTQNAVSVSNGGGITVAGGASIAKDLYIGGNAVYTSTTQSTDTSSGSVILQGGLAVAKNVYIGGNTVIKGDLTIQGTTTTISTVQTLITDNIQIFNAGPSGTSDGGFLIKRYQIDNNSGSGDVVSDSPSITNTLPSQTGASSVEAILHAGASGVDSFYTGWWIKITSGFSANQVRRISGYNGTTKRITVSSAWTTQNPAGGDTFQIFNKPFVGLIYNEVSDRFQFTGTDIEPGEGGSVDFTDEMDLYLRNLTMTGTRASSSLTSAGLLSSGGATFSNTTDATSVTSGGALTLGGGAAIGKSLIVGTTLTVNGVVMTPTVGDIAQTSFTGAQNASNVDVTGLTFANGTTGGFDAWVYVKIVATANLYAHFHLRGVQRASDWVLIQSYAGDSTSVVFSITTSGQIRYTSGSYTGFSSLVMRFRATTLSV